MAALHRASGHAEWARATVAYAESLLRGGGREVGPPPPPLRAADKEMRREVHAAVSAHALLRTAVATHAEAVDAGSQALSLLVVRREETREADR